MGLKKLPKDREMPWALKAFLWGPGDAVGLKSLHGHREIPWDLKALMGTGRSSQT